MKHEQNLMLLAVCWFFFSVCICYNTKDAEIQRELTQLFFFSPCVVSPYMMDASPTFIFFFFREALKSPCYLAIFPLCH